MSRLLPLVILLVGCATSAPSHYGSPPRPADPHGEILLLENRIGSLMQSGLGTARSPEPPPLEQPVAPLPQPAPGAAPEEPPPSPSVSAAPGRPVKAARRSWRCSRMDDVADEICDAAGRICVLAGELGDGDSARSCSRAQRDCSRSREIASSCR